MAKEFKFFNIFSKIVKQKHHISKKEQILSKKTLHIYSKEYKLSISLVLNDKSLFIE